MKNIFLIITLISISAIGQVQPFNFDSEFKGEVKVPNGINPTNAVNKAQLDLKANDADVVKLSGNQTIAGIKTFSSSPIVPTATLSTQAVNKGQMDAAISASSGTLQQIIDNSNDGFGNLEGVFPSGAVIQSDGTDGLIISGGSTKYLSVGKGNSGSFSFDNDNTIFNDANEKGIQYDQDYSSGYSDRSLVDKGSVGQIVIDFLKTLPNYNASTTQVLGHDTGGNIQWQAP